MMVLFELFPQCLLGRCHWVASQFLSICDGVVNALPSVASFARCSEGKVENDSLGMPGTRVS